MLLLLLLCLMKWGHSCAQTEAIDSLVVASELLVEADSLHEAVVLYDRISHYYLNEADTSSFLRTQLSKVMAYQKMGMHQEALQMYLTHEHTYETALEKMDAGYLGLYFHKRGVSEYYVDDYLGSVESYQYAILYRGKLISPNAADLVKTYSNLGSSYIQLYDLTAAEESYSTSLNLNLKMPHTDSILLVRTYKNLSYILAEKRDYIKSKNYLDLAYHYAKSVHQDEPWIIGTLLIDDQFKFFQKSGDIQGMKSCLNEGIDIFNSFDEKYDEDHWAIADAYNNLGIAYWMNDSLLQSVHYYEKALSINLDYGERRQAQAADNYNNLSVVFEEMNDHRQSISQSLKSRRIVESLSDTFLIARTYHNTALNYLKQGDTSQAIKDIDHALHLLEMSSSLIDGNIENYIDLLEVKADALYSKSISNKDPALISESIIVFDKIDKYLHTMRLDFDSDKSKESLGSRSRSIYDKAIAAAYDLYELSDDWKYIELAFKYIEHSKSLSLLDALKNTEAEILSGISHQTLTSLDSLKKAVAAKEVRLLTAAENEIELKDQLVRDKIRINLITNQIEAEYEDYKSIKYSQTDMSMDELRSCCLEDDQSLIEYYLTDTVLYVLIINSAKEELVKVPIQQDLAKSIESFRAGISMSASVSGLSVTDRDSAWQSFVQHSRALYSQLILPITQKEELLHRLTIIPDGVLGYLTFDALLDSEVEPDDLVYVSSSHVISYAYSAQLLQMSRPDGHSSQYHHVLGMAPSFFAGNSLSDLVFNEKEVDAISEIFRTKKLYRGDADKQAFEELVPRYNVIHISSHAVVNDSIPDLSYVALSQLSDTIDHDELYYISELYHLDLSADLIVLSACETGIGKLEAGEGIMSLSRSFTYAGAKSIVSSLWNIDDQFSTEIIKDFYLHISEGDKVDVALWKSKQAAIDHDLYQHPYYWASLIPIGKMDSLSIDDNAYSILWIGIIISVILALISFYYIRRRST